MKHGSLFSGIGGFDLAAHWMGWNNIFHCEKDKFCQRVLQHHFPNSITYEDITKTDFTIHRGEIDILTGGFPCQPFSQAGKRKGTADDRHLWPEMLRAIREIEPGWILGENVYGITNWDGGVVFEQVCAELEAEGYEVQPIILPAAGLNAPHKRYRVWFVAYNNSYGLHRQHSKDEKHTGKRGEYAQCNIVKGFDNGITTNTNSKRNRQEHKLCTRRKMSEKRTSKGNDAYTNTEGLGGCKINRSINSIWAQQNKQPTRLLQPNWQDFPTKSPVCSRDDGFPDRLDGITFSKWRKESIKAYGNAIVPQVAYEIFKVIKEFNNN